MTDYSRNVPHIISNVRRSINNYLQDSLEELGFEGIVPSHGDLLSNLFRNGDMTMTELARNIKRDRSTVTTLVSKLERQGMVRLVENKEDLRSKKVALTSKGRKFKHDFVNISNKMLEKLWNNIDESEKALFINVLLKIQDNFSNIDKS